MLFRSPGSTATLEVLRGGRKVTLKIKLDERPDSPDGREIRNNKHDNGNNGKSSKALEDFGIEDVTPVTSGLRRQYRLGSDSEGLVITNVDSSSPAASAGLREGDLLLQVNGRDVKTLGDLDDAMHGVHKSVVLMIERESGTFIVSLKREKDD